MPKIILSSGKAYRYKTIPLYPGIKQINKEIATENLILLKNIFDKYEIPFQLAAGTLLGIIRESDFISHDEDIDIALNNMYRETVINLLPILRSYGFELCRYDRRDLYSIIRKGEYIDLYFFKPYKPGLSFCSGWVVKESHLQKSTTIEFKGQNFLIPEEYNEYLIVEYGENWMTPIKWNDYNQASWKRILYNFKEYVKDYIPTPIFNWLASKSEKKMIEKSLRHLSRIGIEAH